MIAATRVEAGVTVTRLQVARGGQPVLHGVDCTVRAGLVTGVLGPSGSGKTTLLRSIVGVQRIASGAVEVLGLPAGDPALRRRVAYVTQEPAVYRDLSARENLRYFAAVLGANGDSVERALETVSLTEHAERPVGRLSGGQRGRVSLATALLGEPEVLVLDEPTVGLDPVLRRELWSVFHRIAGDGATLLVSSHVMDEADRCDQLLLLREGRLLADETPASLRQATGCDDLESAFLHLIEESR